MNGVYPDNCLSFDKVEAFTINTALYLNLQKYNLNIKWLLHYLPCRSQKGACMYIPKSIKLSIITTSIMLGMSTLPSHAQIPVIDTSNIMQQAKTLAETVKVVTNTAQQIQLQLQELKSWPEEQLNKLTAKFDGGIQKITDTINSKTSILGDLNKGIGKEGWSEKGGLSTNEIKDLLSKSFPEIGTTTNLAANQDALQASKRNGWSILSKSNIDTLQKYHQYTQMVADATKELGDLVKMSDKAIGAKQSAQIGNRISAVKGRIDGINSILSALTGQQAALKEAQELQEKKNEEIATKSRIEANINAINSESKSAASSTLGEDPWVKLIKQRGHSSWIGL